MLARSFPLAARLRAVRRSVRRTSFIDDLMIGIPVTPFAEKSDAPRAGRRPGSLILLVERARNVKGFLPSRPLAAGRWPLASG
jgi:hypothetical protein